MLFILIIFVQIAFNLKFLYDSLDMDLWQDIERGILGAGPTVEEAIDTLIKSYEASERYQQVRKQVAEICKQVIN